MVTSKVVMSNHAGIGAPEIVNIFNDWFLNRNYLLNIENPQV